MTTILALVLAAASGVTPGPWRATLATSIGELPFEMDVARSGDGWAVTIHNGAERIERPLAVESGTLRVEFPHYDSTIVARLDGDGRSMTGAWTTRGTDGHPVALDFRATAGAAPRFAPETSGPASDDAGGRWSLRFEGASEPAVLVLSGNGDALAGTVLTATGDHRWLAGTLDGARLRLSCFDGAHAFLYDAKVAPDGTLAGSFASGAKPARAFTARRDEKAAIPDEFARARWSDTPGLLWIEGLDAGGKPRSVGEMLFDARALVLQVAGSWCPNCHDELHWLAPLVRELAPRGLRAVTLGFETPGAEGRELRQLARMRERHGADHPFLLVGTPDKERAATALPALDRVPAFPTLAILRADGSALAVHSGFSGPATGADHERATKALRARIEEALAAPETPSAALELLVNEGLWRNERDRTFVEVRREGERVAFVEREMLRFDGPTREEPVAQGFVDARGDVLRLGDALWQLDRRALVALDPRDLAHRLTPAARGPFPCVGDGRARGVALDAPEQLLAGLTSEDPVLRRESVWFLAAQIQAAQFAPPGETPAVDPASAAQIVPRLDDADPLVRATACWAAGALRVEGVREKLRTNADHPFAAVRREAQRALALFEQPPEKR